MDAILNSLQAFQDKKMDWAPEKFQDIQHTELRDAVRSVFRKPSEYIVNLLQKGTVEDMNTLDANLIERACFMKTAALAGFLDLMYKQDEQGTPISKEVLQWYRQKGWKFPKFQCEETDVTYTADTDRPYKKIDTKQEDSGNVPAE
jgi:hypothetical protein